MKEIKKHQGQRFRRFENDEGSIFCECRKCKQVKPETPKFFYRQKTAKTGLRSICKVCCDGYQMDRYRNEEGFKEQIYEQSRRWAKSNPEKIKQSTRRSREKALQKDPEGFRERTKLSAEKFRNKQSAGIYKIVCSVNGKIYIGQTKNLDSRWTSHKSALNLDNGKTNAALQADWNKFGEDSFTFEVVAEFPKDRKKLLLEEARIILKLEGEGVELYNSIITEEQMILLQEET